MTTIEQARDIAAAFLTLFLDSTKRTAECHDAFLVYSPNSVARITREKVDNQSEEITLNGVQEISLYNVRLPPSALTLNSYDALPIVDGAILIQATGTEIIEITDYPWSRAMVLVPTPQGGFYLKSDLLHYHLGAVLPTTTETIEVLVDQAKPFKKQRAQRPQKPKLQAVKDDEQQPVAVVAAVPELAAAAAVTVPVIEVAPVVEVPEVLAVVEVAPVHVIEEVVIKPASAPVKKQQPKATSWAALARGNQPEPEPVVEEQPEPVKKQPRAKKNVDVDTTTTTTTTPATPTEPQQVTPKDVTKMAFVKNIPSSVSFDTLNMVLLQLGDIVLLQFESGRSTATVHFKTKADADAAIAAGQVPLPDGGKITLVPKQAKVTGRDGFRNARR